MQRSQPNGEAAFNQSRTPFLQQLSTVGTMPHQLTSEVNFWNINFACHLNKIRFCTYRPTYQNVRQVFDRPLKFSTRGLDPNRDYHLTVYESNEINAYFVVNSDNVFISKGLLNELDKYLKSKGKSGITLDHVAVILAHELEHSVQNFDSTGKFWFEKQGESRKHEYDSDIESIFASDEAGYNPEAMVDVMDFFIYLEANIS